MEGMKKGKECQNFITSSVDDSEKVSFKLPFKSLFLMCCHVVNLGEKNVEKSVFKNYLFQRKQPYVLYVLEYENVAKTGKLIFGDSGKSQRSPRMN